MLKILIYSGILLSLIFVAWIDFRHKKISNNWSIFNLIAFVGLVSFSPLHHLSFELFVYPGILLLSGFVLFTLKVMGGGDAKYLATLFLLLPIEWQSPFFELLILSTALVGCMLIIVNILRNYSMVIKELRNRNLEGLRSCFGTRFSYAPVILLAWLWFAVDYRILN